MSAKTDIDHLIGLCETAIHNANNAENGTNINTVKVQANETNISSAYHSGLYLTGDYAIHNNILWKCLSTTTNTPRDGAEWVQTNITDMLIDLANRISELETIKEV